MTTNKDAERITAALVRQSIRAIKRQSNYDYSIIRNHCNSRFVKTAAYNRIMERQNAAHQKLAPSPMERWGTCTGRIQMADGTHLPVEGELQIKNTTHQQARYIGDKKKLTGKTALIRNTEASNWVAAQFDDLELTWRGTNLAHGWHEFRREEFEVLNGEETKG